MLQREVGFPRRKRRPALLLTLLALGGGVHWIHGRYAHPSNVHAIWQAEMEARAYTLDAYPQWRMRQHSKDRECPRSLYDLNAYLQRTDILDPWGSRYLLSCDYYTDGHVQYVWVESPGPDREIGTRDDIRSHW